jgi:hypothetical protein
MTENDIIKSNAITQELNKLKCTNPDCEKSETIVNNMCAFTITKEGEFNDLYFSDKICCELFKKEIEKKYNHLRKHLIIK